MDSNRILVVGGHTRNIGKTSLVVDLIRALPQADWTAVKITQYGHGVCSVNGESCGCAPAEHPFSISEETSRDGTSDTSRFLLAGARRALWVRTKQGQLATAMPALRDAITARELVVMESNSLLGFVRPGLYLSVLDPTIADFKESSQRYLDLTDAFVLRTQDSPNVWAGVPAALLARKPQYYQPLGKPLPAELVSLVRSRFAL